MDNNAALTAIQQFDKLFISPEIAKRRSAKELPADFRLRAWQVVFFPDGKPPVVRLNGEVKIVAVAKAKRAIAKGEVICENDIDAPERLELSTEDDPDCAHASAVHFKDSWIFAFDFRYNKAHANKHFTVAEEFLSSAESAAEKGHFNAFADNLFSASELLARAILLLIPDPKFKKGTTHKDTQIRFNKFAATGNIPEPLRVAFNKLAGLRTGSRYLKEESELSESERHGLLDSIRDLRDHVKTAIGREARHPKSGVPPN